MDHEPFIVECGECRQPFAVPLQLFTAIAGDELTVPSHRRLEPDGREPTCDGGHVLDGSRVKPRRIR